MVAYSKIEDKYYKITKMREITNSGGYSQGGNIVLSGEPWHFLLDTHWSIILEWEIEQLEVDWG